MNSNPPTNSPPPKLPDWLSNVIDAGWEAYTVSRSETRKLGPWKDFEAAVTAALRRAFALFGGGGKWRHKIRQTSYEVIARGTLQTVRGIEDGCELYAYVGDDGKVWFRPVAEFEDGRFVREE